MEITGRQKSGFVREGIPKVHPYVVQKNYEIPASFVVDRDKSLYRNLSMNGPSVVVNPNLGMEDSHRYVDTTSNTPNPTTTFDPLLVFRVIQVTPPV